jgi:hypothetical protein
MDKPCVITTKINGADALAIVDPNEYYSVITTGLLEILKIKCNNVRFTREQITLFEENLETLGKIKRFKFTLEFVLLHHDVYILDNKSPLLLFGQDLKNKHKIRYNILRTHLFLQHQCGRMRVPIHEEEPESELIESSDAESTGSITESEHESWTTNETDNNSAVEELLIDFAEVDDLIRILTL